MTNQPELSPRAQKTLDILANGGRFVVRLERDRHTGREMFAHRLIDDARNVVRGVGVKAFYEIKDTFLRMCDGGNTTVSTYYKLRAD